jgi:photosystem II stability/assembly factor-like uncharacterized protein
MIGRWVVVGTCLAGLLGATCAALPKPSAAGRTTASDRSAAPASALGPNQETEYFTPIGGRTAWTVTVSLEGSTRDRVLRTVDSGRKWSDVTPRSVNLGRRIQVTSAFFLNRQVGWFAYASSTRAPPSHILETSDGGSTWTRLASLMVGGCSLRFVTSQDGWCMYQKASGPLMAYRTVDSGRTWTRRRLSGGRGLLPSGCTYDVQFLSPPSAFAGVMCGGRSAGIYGSDDGGERWRAEKIVPFGSHFTDQYFAPPMVGNQGNGAVVFEARRGGAPFTVMYRTDDLGRRWVPVRIPGRLRVWDADVVTPRVWRLVTGSTILETENAGHSWARVVANREVGLFGSSTGVDFSTPQVGWLTNPPGSKLLRTSDGGSIWRSVALPGGSL